MKTLINYLTKNPLVILIVALPLSIFAEVWDWGETWVFILSAISIIPLAEYIGQGTEALASHTSPRMGGLLNATLGNAAELIITIVAIREGLLELVKASITGSIIGNLLFVMGLSMLLGGIRHGIQSFNARQASRNAILLILAVLALVIPSLFSHSIGPETSLRVEAFSEGIAAVMILLYVLALIFSFKADGAPLAHKPSEASDEEPVWPINIALAILAMATIGVVIGSELLVGSVRPVVEDLGVSEFFLGVILIPIIGNVAEHLVAVEVALRNHMELSVEIAIASSLQVSLFVAPVLVFISLLMGNPLQLIFNQFELLALVAGVTIMALVSSDGESNWLEGAELLAVYFILSLAFFLLPT